MGKLNWKKVIGWAVAALVIIGVVGTNMYQKCEQKGDRPIVKIGALYPMSGAAAVYGEVAQKAADIFIEDFNKAHPNRKYDYKVIFEDVEMSTSKALSATQKLIALDKVDGVVSLFSSMAIAILPIAQREKILNLVYGTDPRAADGEFTFRLAANMDILGDMYAKKMAEKGYKRVSMIIQSDDAGSVARSGAIEQAIKKQNLTLTGKHQVFQNDKDFTTLLFKIKEEKPDVITVNVYPGIADLLLLRMKHLEINIPVVGDGVVLSLNDKTLGEGSWGVDDGAPNQDFISKMGTENTLYGEFIYTQLQIIANAFENTPAKSGEKPDMLAVSKTLREKTAGMESPFGTIDMNDKGEIYVPAVYKTIRNGKVELLTE